VRQWVAQAVRETLLRFHTPAKTQAPPRPPPPPVAPAGVPDPPVSIRLPDLPKLYQPLRRRPRFRGWFLQRSPRAPRLTRPRFCKCPCDW
jgi:hypothetical protein